MPFTPYKLNFSSAKVKLKPNVKRTSNREKQLSKHKRKVKLHEEHGAVIMLNFEEENQSPMLTLKPKSTKSMISNFWKQEEPYPKS